MREHVFDRSALQQDMSYCKTYHEVRNVLHDYISSDVLFKCNFFLKSFGLSITSGICEEDAIDYAAVSLDNCCHGSFQKHFYLY